ncbi:DUF1002 domain-containing protein [Lentilactobacillus senioris]|uniref:DUF1002 domain-containing protein n=1 Tax=Lentilactobacillus senioris TaxID=931534 RepID=UPI0022806383|nr:DUF1002 domain-containing protein [Lentilactobacillus senioris]MCY9807085.1 DUF1002 domain-containing protein [Lentilactobacillus senioris]
MKKTNALLIMVAVLGIGTAVAKPVHAALTTNSSESTTATSDSSSSDSTEAVQTKALTSPYVVYGAGLASEDKDQIKETLGVSSNYKSLTATGSDYAKYINSAGTTDASMISSVALAPADPGTGVKVNIEKFNGQDNITEVTSQQYAMVATMAGVNDVIITVTANKSVSGESALTGVYEALAADGISLDNQNTQAANGVLDATQSAIDQNSSDDKYPGKLMGAVGNVSSELAEDHQKNGDYATNEEIKQMLEDELDKQGIKSDTSVTVINNIVVALANVQKAPVSNTKSYVKNASKVADEISNSVGDKMADLSDFANSEDAKKAEGFLANIWNSIVSFFQNLFN